jgi:hypothetical protein
MEKLDVKAAISVHKGAAKLVGFDDRDRLVRAGESGGQGRTRLARSS